MLFPLFAKSIGEDRAVIRIDPNFFPQLIHGEEIHEFQTESRYCRSFEIPGSPMPLSLTEKGKVLSSRLRLTHITVKGAHYQGAGLAFNPVLTCQPKVLPGTLFLQGS
jgi:hypothetical protein